MSEKIENAAKAIARVVLQDAAAQMVADGICDAGRAAEIVESGLAKEWPRHMMEARAVAAALGFDWQPIATAPKNGTRILLQSGTTVTEGRWTQRISSDAERFEDAWLTFAVGTVGSDWPNSWAPLPTP
jgi:hypothetical protein